jgi:hypothetical protein
LTLATGTRLGRYEIRSKIGEGGMEKSTRVAISNWVATWR